MLLDYSQLKRTFDKKIAYGVNYKYISYNKFDYQLLDKYSCSKGSDVRVYKNL